MANLRYLEPEEVYSLLEVIPTRSLIALRNRVALQIMAECATRLGETISIRPRDVNITEKRIYIENGKGGRSRTVYWHSNSLSDYLAKWKEVRPQGEFLFVNVRGATRGTQVSSRNIQKAIQMYAKRAGIPVTVTCHMLRHGRATQMLREGTSIRTVQEALGHKSVQTTQIYTHITNRDVELAMRGF